MAGVTKGDGRGHCHQSLFDKKTGKTAMFDAKDVYHLTEMARHFVGGQLSRMREIIGVLAPTVNSYKRLVPGYEARSALRAQLLDWLGAALLLARLLAGQTSSDGLRPPAQFSPHS